MEKDLQVWKLILEALAAGRSPALLLVTENQGSSPGRQGFKMAVTREKRMTGSIGGGIMEHKLIEKAIHMIAGRQEKDFLKKQIHRDDIPTDRSGMICSGEQTVLIRVFDASHLGVVRQLVTALENNQSMTLEIDPETIAVRTGDETTEKYTFQRYGPSGWVYTEKLGFACEAYIIGGGHVGLAMSRLLRTIDFYVINIDDREGLYTMDANLWAHEKKVIPYDKIAEAVPEGDTVYVIIMTFGYRTDEVILKNLLDKNYRYLGMMGSQAKVDRMFSNLLKEGYSGEQLARVKAPVGVPVNSRTPDEIAISIAAEIIAQKNKKD